MRRTFIILKRIGEKIFTNRLLVYPLVIGLFTVSLLLAVFVISDKDSDKLRVYFFAVGQGDAHLIRTPTGQNILIDGGPDNQILRKLGSTLPFWERTIDLIVLTHPHSDHISGLVEVIRRYEVKRVLATGVKYNTPIYSSWLALVQEKNLIFDKALAGQNYVLGENMTLQVLSPDRLYLDQKVDDINETSIILRLEFGKTAFLFTGDASKMTEYRLLARHHCYVGVFVEEEKPTLNGNNQLNNNCAQLQAQVLKVAHQGSVTSSSEEFLRVVKPHYAVIPVGKNKFGHPSARVLRRLERIGAAVIRTDKEGDIKFVSDGNQLKVFTAVD